MPSPGRDSISSLSKARRLYNIHCSVYWVVEFAQYGFRVGTNSPPGVGLTPSTKGENATIRWFTQVWQMPDQFFLKNISPLFDGEFVGVQQRAFLLNPPTFSLCLPCASINLLILSIHCL